MSESYKKRVVAVPPYVHPGALNFKMPAFRAWQKVGGRTAESHYPPRVLHGAAFRWALPSVRKSTREARLRFVEPVSLLFDTFPDYARREVIPFVWDCWPRHFDTVCRFFRRHGVRTAFFTSAQTAERMRSRFPEMNIFHIAEGIDTSLYREGKPLTERAIDLLEYGRGNGSVVRYDLPPEFNHVRSRNGERLFKSDDDLFAALADAKITVALPRSWTQPEIAGDIETLTQRYWEAMLSRNVMVGHAPEELVRLLGYNPVIELDRSRPNEQLTGILRHIGDHQALVNRNRAAAMQHADWTLRMKQVRQQLAECGYEA